MYVYVDECSTDRHAFLGGYTDSCLYILKPCTLFIWTTRHDTNSTIHNHTTTKPKWPKKTQPSIYIKHTSCTEQQLELFSRASVVVAPHGAAESLLVASPPETTCVIELLDPEYLNICFLRIAVLRNLRYVAVPLIAGVVDATKFQNALKECEMWKAAAGYNKYKYILMVMVMMSGRRHRSALWSKHNNTVVSGNTL